MRTPLSNTLLLLGILASVAAMAVYPYLPQKRLSVLPDGSYQRQLLQAYTANEVTISYWQNWDEFEWGCQNTASGGERPICALSIFFGTDFTKGVDVSQYDALVLDSSFFGDNELVRIFVRNFNPEYSKVNDDNSAKYMSLTLPSQELAVPQPIRIALNEFSVADWWLAQHPLEHSFLPLEFNNITLLRIDFGEFFEGHQQMGMRIKDLYFEGPLVSERNWYAAIAGSWVVAVSIGLILQMFSLYRRNRFYRHEIAQLANEREVLSRESQKYQTLSHLDPLTRVYNRLGLEKQMKRLGSLAAFRPTAVIILDIDHFKQINDSRGHNVGDKVLTGVAKILSDSIRQDDILARWGGEEFVLIAPHTVLETAYKLAEKLRILIAQHTFEPTLPLQVTCSFGVTQLYSHEEFNLALERADKALYAAKQQGRNRTVLDEV